MDLMALPRQVLIFLRQHIKWVMVVALLIICLIMLQVFQIGQQTWPMNTSEKPYKHQFSNHQLYHDPQISHRIAPEDWATQRPEDAALLKRLAEVPTAIWFGDWHANIANDAAKRLQHLTPNQTAVLVVYNIPHRDCGGQSAGGAENSQAYRDWISELADGIDQAKTIIIIEPDALAGIECLSDAEQQERYELITYAVNTLGALPQSAVYIDAGHSAWKSASEMADRLTQAGIAQADGFSLNVSNFNTTQAEIAYGTEISHQTGHSHFVIDTSRNGLGAGDIKDWCNPPDRAVGDLPTLTTNWARVDALLWIKAPGESDGTCNGGPEAGQWWPEYALGLVKRANW